MNRDELVRAYNEALRNQGAKEEQRISKTLLDLIFTKIMAEDEYQARTH